MRPKLLLALVAIIAIFGMWRYYESHSQLITNHPSHGTDIIAFGDSLIAGTGSTDGHNFVSLLSQKIGQPIINLGRSGDTTGDAIPRLKELDAYHPKVVILLLGGNDYLRQVPIEETRANLATLIENIQARGAIVLLLGIQGGILNDRFRGEFESLRDIYHTAYIPNVLQGILGNELYMSDTVHPNNAGYQKIADTIYPTLLTLIH